MIETIYRCDICGEVIKQYDPGKLRKIDILSYDHFLDVWKEEEYIYCRDCFENMKKYCREHKGGKK